MAYTPWDTYVDTVPVPTTIEELQQALQLKYNTTWPEIANQITSLGGDPTNFDELADLCGLGSIKSADGTSTMWYYKDTLDDFSYTPVSSVSTNTYTSRSTVQTPMNTSIDDVTGKVTVSNTPKTGSFTQDATYVLGEIGQATTILSVGTWLGKKLSNAIYENAPNYFPDIDWSSFNPDTWASITKNDDSLGAQLFNFIFGIDPNTGNGQAYIDADAAAYLAYAINQEGWFEEGEPSATYDGDMTGWPYTIEQPLMLGFGADSFYTSGQQYNDGYYYAFSESVYLIRAMSASNPDVYAISSTPFLHVRNYQRITPRPTPTQQSIEITTYNGTTAYYAYYGPASTNKYYKGYTVMPHSVMTGSGSAEKVAKCLATIIFDGVIDTGGPVEGLSNQSGATLPNTTTWVDIPSTDSYLRTTYPDTYNDALQYDVLQPDGNVVTKTYIPVPFPENITSPNIDTNNDPWNNPQPTTDGANQTNPLIDIATSTDDFIKQLIKTITQTVQTTNTDNPTTTGTGETPTLVPIAGTSTALWSVYNPTKAQIDSFGAWLWTDNVIQQFIQLLNNPMEGIITLHKVFATPVISGTGTIVVGRLDSGVGSNLVSQQYVTVDCGSVRIDEYFGNVFDYSPHTTISLYLPFIGFVPLNVDDVMRSTISISYGVDVFTGACLATVNVDRDGNSVGLYQYSGVASVEYPLTGAQHGGLINGLLGVAGGVAGIALASTGVGVVAGASAIAGGLTNAAKTSNARSGGFSGNAGAMGVKIPYLIIERPITKVANTFDILNGYPTNHDSRLGDCSGNVIVKYVHVEGINATEQELSLIESMLKSGVVV